YNLLYLSRSDGLQSIVGAIQRSFLRCIRQTGLSASFAGAELRAKAKEKNAAAILSREKIQRRWSKSHQYNYSWCFGLALAAFACPGCFLCCAGAAGCAATSGRATGLTRQSCSRSGAAAFTFECAVHSARTSQRRLVPTSSAFG